MYYIIIIKVYLLLLYYIIIIFINIVVVMMMQIDDSVSLTAMLQGTIRQRQSKSYPSKINTRDYIVDINS